MVPLAAPAEYVFIGTYTDYSVLAHFAHGTPGGPNGGLAVSRWRAGRLEPLHTTRVLNPAFMKYHPRLNVLYVLSECIDRRGYLTAYNVDPATGELSELGRLDMSGKSSCYISFDADASHAVVTNYWDGLIDVIALDPCGMPTRVVQSHQQTARPAWRQVADSKDHMSNRQDGPHAHCCVFHPSYRWLFVPDLGDNGIHQYGWDGARLTHQAFIALPAGHGPRHFVFHPTHPIAFSGCELGSRLQMFSVDTSEPDTVRPRIAPLSSLPTLPEGWSGVNYVGEIKLDAPGRTLYVSNRGHDSVAVFSVDATSGTVARVSVDPTGGRTPRHFGLSPCGRFAVVGDQDSDVVRVFTRCPDTGRLTLLPAADLALPSPCFVLFQRPHGLVPAHMPATPAVRASSGALDTAALVAGHEWEQLEVLSSPTAVVACS